jgi:hypothetical protein
MALRGRDAVERSLQRPVQASLKYDSRTCIDRNGSRQQVLDRGCERALSHDDDPAGDLLSA